LCTVKAKGVIQIHNSIRFTSLAESTVTGSKLSSERISILDADYHNAAISTTVLHWISAVG
jgi:hypothetical protein